ncbi:MAG TPA: hypothetical protein P5307_17180, partial [Pirellulaceae bacterium]|nr:hypothetical protein [Pirellulaceae bacterium]
LDKIVQRTLSSDPLGRAFDHFFQEQAAPEAVRARTQLVADRIAQTIRTSKKDKIRVCSIGSGPAIDVELACSALSFDERKRLEVTLMDLDPDALVHAEQRLARVVAADQVHSHRENLFRLPQLKRATTLLEQSDFIACTGMFDYLDDAAATAMLQYFWNGLAEQGEVIVFNFAPSNPSQSYMEWIGNWYLIYRDEEAMQDLGERSIGSSSAMEIAREDSQASLYLACRKT